MESIKQISKDTRSPVLSARAAADYLGLGLRTLRMLSETGRLPVVRLSPRRIGFLRSDLDEYIARQRQ